MSSDAQKNHARKIVAEVRKNRELIVLATAILNEKDKWSPKELKRIAKDALNRVGMDWDRKKNSVILK